MNEAELKGLILLLLPAGGYALSLYRHGQLLVRLLRWAIGFVQRQAKLHETKPPANGNGNGSRQMVDQALILALKSDSARLDITQDAIKRLDEKIEEYALKTQRMVDGVIFGMNDLKRATNERLGKMEIQMSELLTIARNGNGKHPPGDQPGDTKS